MASTSKTITWNNFNASTLQDFDKVIVDNIFQKNMLLKKLNDGKNTYDGGPFITVPVEYATGNGGAYTGYQELDPTDKEIITNAMFDPAHYEVDITISKTDFQKNRGPGKIFDLVEAKTNNALKTMRKNLTTDMFGTGGTNTAGAIIVTGLQAQVADDPTSNPSWGNVGGIDRSVAAGSYFRNQIKDFGAISGITMYAMQQLLTLCSDDDERPDIIVCDTTFFDKLWSLADGRQRLGNEEAAKMGYTSIDFNRIPIIVDKNCPAKHLYMINTDYLYLKVDPTDDMVPTQWLMGTRQLAQTKYITWTGQIVCSNPRYQGVGFYT